MQKKTLGLGIFLVAVFIFIGVIGMTAEAEVTTADGVITIDTEHYTLDSIWADANVTNTNLTNCTDGTWLLNWSLYITNGAVLEISPDAGSTGCTWLKLNTTNATGETGGNIFVANGGTLWVNDTMITAWNHTGGLADGHNNTYWWNGTDPVFRPYIIIGSEEVATYAYFLNSTLGYLGYNGDSSTYGIVYGWDGEGLDPVVYGWMHNCTVLENYIGIDFQGCWNMNVTNSWFNDTKEVGIVYTTASYSDSDNGYIGDHPTWTHRALYDGVRVDTCYEATDEDPDGIRINGCDNMTLYRVNITDALNCGLYMDTCNNTDGDYITAYSNGELNIFLAGVTNSSFDNSTVYSPDDGENWVLIICTDNTFDNCMGYDAIGSDFILDGEEGPCSRNTFTDCTANNSGFGFFCSDDDNNTFNRCISYEHIGVGEDVGYDFFFDGSVNDACTDCVANNSDIGYLGRGDSYNTVTDCISHNQTLYDYKLWGSQNDTITNGYANDSTIGVYIMDFIPVAGNNTVTGIDINRQSSYGIKIGIADDVCHNNTIEAVTVVGTTTGDGIFIFGNCTYNYVGNSTVTSLTPTTSGGFGAVEWASHNTFYNCNSSSNAGYGYYVAGHANYNAVTLCESSDGLYGVRIAGNANNNTVTTATVTGTTVLGGIYLFDNATYNNISSCTVSGLSSATSGGLGATDWATYNTFYNCDSYSNGGIGFYLLGNSSNNAITLCEANDTLYGLLMTAYANNNTVNHSDFNNNTWIGIWVSADSISTGGNEVWHSTCHDNFYGIYLEDTPLVSFTEVDAYNNTCYGVAVTDGAVGYFFNCIADNETVAQYDWYVSNTSTADIYSPYILGFDKNINYQFDTAQPYGVASHDAGDGIWELNTTQMTVSCQADNTTTINLTLRTATKVRWYATSVSGTELYQKIGGLVPGERYDLKVRGNIQSTNFSANDTMLATQGTTGYVWFNYTGSWSTLSFEVRRHVAVDGDADEGGTWTPPPAEAVPDTDGDGLNDDLEEQIGTNPLLSDTDGDGFTDYEEYIAGTDPLDPTDYPEVLGGSFLFIPIVFWLFIIIPLIVVAVLQFTYVASIKSIKKKKQYQVLLLLALTILTSIGLILYFFI